MARNATTATGVVTGTPSLIRWSSVVGGAVIGLALLVLLATLLGALAVGTGAEGLRAAMGWAIGGSAIVAMFVGGLLAGWLSGVPGAWPGLFNGLTVWALVIVVAIALGIPGLMQAIGIEGLTETTIGVEPATAAWAGFVSLLIGAVAAGLGGALGGATTRPAFVYAAPRAETIGEDRREEPRREAGEVGETHRLEETPRHRR